MKDKKYNPQPLILTEGYFSEYSYDSVDMLVQKGPKNWKHGCPFQLASVGLSGQTQILQLCSMQITYSTRHGAAMYNVASAKDSLSIVMIKMSEGQACFDRVKFKGGDIIFFDDSHPHNWIANDVVEYVIITIQKSTLPAELSNFSKLIGHTILDTDARLLTTLNKIKKSITNDPTKKNTKGYRKAEDKIFAVIMGLLSKQTPAIPNLTGGEKIALEIRDQIFHHMDGDMSISSLAKEHNVSKQTLQNGFNSLFGYTPKRFFRLLKLNLVYQELMESNPNQNIVTEIALKWGFIHMGRFSAYYKELFGEYPSQTLKTPYYKEKGLLESCVERQEEMM